MKIILKSIWNNFVKETRIEQNQKHTLYSFIHVVVWFKIKKDNSFCRWTGLWITTRIFMNKLYEFSWSRVWTAFDFVNVCLMYWRIRWRPCTRLCWFEICLGGWVTMAPSVGYGDLGGLFPLLRRDYITIDFVIAVGYSCWEKWMEGKCWKGWLGAGAIWLAKTSKGPRDWSGCAYKEVARWGISWLGAEAGAGRRCSKKNPNHGQTGWQELL